MRQSMETWLHWIHGFLMQISSFLAKSGNSSKLSFSFSIQSSSIDATEHFSGMTVLKKTNVTIERICRFCDASSTIEFGIFCRGIIQSFQSWKCKNLCQLEVNINSWSNFILPANICIMNCFWFELTVNLQYCLQNVRRFVYFQLALYCDNLLIV